LGFIVDNDDDEYNNGDDDEHNNVDDVDDDDLNEAFAAKLKFI
jgi:hypothetical protein